MKNQNDLIVAGAVVLVCIGVSLAFFFQKREPVAPPAPQSVVVTDAVPVPASVQYANNLPGGGGAQQGGQAAGAPQGPTAAGLSAGGGPTVAGVSGG